MCVVVHLAIAVARMGGFGGWGRNDKMNMMDGYFGYDCPVFLVGLGLASASTA